MIPYAIAATIAAAGRVTIQAITMFPATPQRTADRRLVEPTPMMAEVIVCVVDTGACQMNAVAYRMLAAVAAAANPCGGSSSMTLRPSVRMIRHPPAYVPNDSTAALARI